MQGQGFFMDLLREFVFFPIDQIVYNLIELFYNLFAFVSELTIFSDGDFQKFTTKVYLLLGVFMLFKLAFTLINLFANPDNLMDSQKGVVGIVKRIIISLILITFVPTIFNLGYKFQTIIIKDNIIGNFFLGDLVTDSSDKTVANIQKNAGKMVSFNVFSAFYYPENFVLEKDENGANKVDKDGNIQFIDDGGKKGSWSSDAKACVEYVTDYTCANSLENEKLYNHIKTKSFDMSNLKAFVVKDKKTDEGKYYVMHYTFLISTVAGVVVAWLFFGFCFDAAIRVIKLSVLQLIAPIPIFSYIDPKKGESVFNNWVKTTLTTYGSLLARLILIYFVIYVLYLFNQNGIQQFDANGTPVGINTSDPLYPFAKMLVYIGLLLFAKDAPKLFADMFGIKMEGSFGSKLAKMGMVGTGLAVGLGATKMVGETSKAARNFMKKRGLEANRKELLDKYGVGDDESLRNVANEADRKKLDDIKSNFAKLDDKKNRAHVGRAMFAGMTAGMVGGFAGSKLNWSGMKSGMKKANETQKNRVGGVSFKQEAKEKISRFFGESNSYGSFGEWDSKLKEVKNQEQRLAIQENRAREHYSDVVSRLGDKYKISAENMAELLSGNVSGIDNMIEQHTADLRKQRASLEDAYKNDKSLSDSARKNLETNIESLNQQIGTITSDFNGITTVADTVNRLDTMHQDAVKKVSAYQKQLNSVGGKK